MSCKGFAQLFALEAGREPCFCIACTKMAGRADLIKSRGPLRYSVTLMLGSNTSLKLILNPGLPLLLDTFCPECRAKLYASMEGTIDCPACGFSEPQ